MIIRYSDEELKKSKSNDLLKLECEHCGNIFFSKKKLINYELKHNIGSCKYCSVQCSNEHHNKEIKVECSECGKTISITRSVYDRSKTKRFFCNHSCSAKFNNTHRVVLNRKDMSKERICKVCGKLYHYHYGKDGFDYSTKLCCSKECSDELRKNKVKYLTNEQRKRYSEVGTIGALKSVKVQKEIRRSKNEMLFCEYCEKHFNEVKHNESIFNGWDADVIIEDNKYAILWNGRWHYDELSKTTSLKQIQNRDKIKLKEIIKCGYKPYVIKDMGSYNPIFVKEQFDKFLKDIRLASDTDNYKSRSYER